MKADLHVHSTYSDGSNPRDVILRRARDKGITHLAFTEHDTMVGFEEWRPVAAQYGIALIPGVEFSGFDKEYGVRAHILGYGIRDSRPIEALGRPLLTRRHHNSLRQLDILADMGYRISVEDVAPYCQGGILYKQHIMHCMLDKGYVKSIGGEEYLRLFKNGGPCHFDIEYMDSVEAIAAILEAGGIPVLAHPGQQENLHIVPRLVKAGLRGLEFHHHANNPDYMLKIEATATQYGLFLTGGSDHHGLYEERSPDVGDYLSPTPVDVLLSGEPAKPAV